MALSKNTTITVAAAIVVVGVVAYFLWMRPDTQETITTSAGASSEAQATFLTLAAQLDPITFDADVLADTRFETLVDIQTMIQPEVEGRTDPFAPLQGVTAE